MANRIPVDDVSPDRMQAAPDNDGDTMLAGEHHTNCYRQCSLNTPLGSLRLRKLRQDSYFPPFLEPRQTAEKALITVIADAYDRFAEL
jgi:transposase-like protein